MTFWSMAKKKSVLWKQEEGQDWHINQSKISEARWFRICCRLFAVPAGLRHCSSELPRGKGASEHEYPVAFASHTSQKWFAKGSTWWAEEEGSPWVFSDLFFKYLLLLEGKYINVLFGPLPGSMLPPPDHSRTLLDSFSPSVLPSLPLHQFSWHLVGKWLKDLHSMGEFSVCGLFSGVLPNFTYPAWSQLGGDRIICQPTWVTVAVVRLRKKKISEVRKNIKIKIKSEVRKKKITQVRCSWWAKWILSESMEAWMHCAGLLSSSLGDEREWASVFNSLWRDL